MRLVLFTLSLPILLFGCGYSHGDPAADYGYPDVAPEIVVPDDDSEPPRTNPWVETVDQAVSTFSADVDTGSYTLTRRALREGSAIDIDTVRVEEFLNYFRYDTAPPVDDLPFAVDLELGPSVFGHDDDVKLLKIAIQAEQIPKEERDPVNLVFLLDVSGSMASPDKLGLVKFAMKHLVDKLTPTDTLGIVVYAGAEGVVLEPTRVEEKSTILDALDALEAGGSTNGQAGIEAAYAMARQAFREDGVNRVVLCSDGDMNVGLTGQALVDYVAAEREQGVFITTLGFGTGNYQDATMEQLANDADGNYAYIDSPNEALRVLGENLVSTLQVVAKDVKLQVTFDEDVVERWRLIGYENRLLDEADFVNDDVDAGDIGAGHHVTALYELELTDEPLGDAADLAIRYKEPTETTSTEHHWTVPGAPLPLEQTSDDFRFATGVAELAEILRASEYSEGTRFTEVTELVEEARPLPDRTRMQAELVQLIGLAQQRGTP